MEIQRTREIQEQLHLQAEDRIAHKALEVQIQEVQVLEVLTIAIVREEPILLQDLLLVEVTHHQEATLLLDLRDL